MQTENELCELIDRAEITSDGVLVKFDRTEAELAALEKKHRALVYDCSIPESDKAARAGRAELKALRGEIDRRREALKAPHLAIGREIDAQAKGITARVLALESPIDALIKAEETRKAELKAELERINAERIGAIRARIAGINRLAVDGLCMSIEQLQNEIVELNELGVRILSRHETADFGEYEDEAKDAIKAVLQSLENTLDIRREQLAEDLARAEAKRQDDARRAQLEAEAEARRKADESERVELKRLADEERARIDAELATQRAELETQRKAMAEQQARLDAQAAAIEAERLEAQRREQEQAERAKIAEAAMDSAECDSIAANFQAELLPAPDPLQGWPEKFSWPGTPCEPEDEPAPALCSEPRIKLGDINAAIAPLSITADGLLSLGIVHVAQERASKLYEGRDLFRAIDAMQTRLFEAKRDALKGTKCF